MLVDIIIPAYNPGHYLVEALDSAMNQSYKKFTITVIDDCSTQNIRSITDLYPKVQYLRTPKNLGPAGTRNLGIRATRGELISFLDADDVWDPQKLFYSVEEFRKDPAIGATCGNYQIMVNGRLRKPFYNRPPLINWNSLYKINYVASGSVTIKRGILDKLSGPYGFDERFWIAEDFNLWLRLSENYPWKYINHVLYYYRILPGNNSLTQRSDIQANHIENLRIIKEESLARIKAQGKNG